MASELESIVMRWCEARHVGGKLPKVGPKGLGRGSEYPDEPEVFGVWESARCEEALSNLGGGPEYRALLDHVFWERKDASQFLFATPGRRIWVFIPGMNTRIEASSLGVPDKTFGQRMVERFLKELKTSVSENPRPAVKEVA
jgi:hypothetical protein